MSMTISKLQFKIICIWITCNWIYWQSLNNYNAIVNTKSMTISELQFKIMHMWINCNWIHWQSLNNYNVIVNTNQWPFLNYNSI